MLHGIHCIQSEFILPGCMESTAFNHAAWNPLHSIMLHKIHCIQSCCIKSIAFNKVPFLHAAWNPLNSITLHGIHCIQSGCILPCCMDYTAINHTASNSLHSVGMIWAMLHIIHSIQSGWFGLAAWTPLHTIGIHCAKMHGILCIHWRCMDYTAFNRDALDRKSVV